MNALDPAASSPPADGSGQRTTKRVLLVADAAIADISEIPPRARALIDKADQLYVVTPTLPGPLDWLAWQINPSRHAADQRQDLVLDQVRSTGAEARGKTGDDSILTAFADAVAEFRPDHIVIALRSSEHANWQERGLIKHVKQRFGLPLTTFALDPRGHLATIPEKAFR